MKMNKSFLGFLLPSLLLGLSSCGGAKSSASSSESKSSDNTSTPSIPSDLKYDDEGKPIFNNVTLKFWSISIGADGVIQNQIVDRFNDEFDGQIFVERQEKRHDEYSSAVVNTIINDPNNAPDIVVGHGQRICELKTQKIFKPLNQYLDMAKVDFNRDNYYSNIMDDFYYDDDGDKTAEALYGLPLDAHANIIIYRKDILKENNLPVPTNFNELKSVCQQLAQKAKDGTYKYRQIYRFDKTMSWQTTAPNTALYPFYMAREALDDEDTYSLSGAVQNGTKIVNNELPAFNTQETIDYFTAIRELMYPTNSDLPVIKNNNDVEFIDDIYKGNFVFASTGPWNLNGYRDVINSAIGFGPDSFDDTIGILPLSNLLALDASKDCAPSIVGTSHAFSLSKTCTSDTKCAAAMVFADWMTKQYKDWLKGGHLPILKSAMEDQEFLNDPFYLSIGQYLGNQANMTLGGRTPYYSEIFGLERTCGMAEIWHQTINTTTQDKTIAQIVNEQYLNTLSLISDLQ